MDMNMRMVEFTYFDQQSMFRRKLEMYYNDELHGQDRFTRLKKLLLDHHELGNVNQVHRHILYFVMHYNQHIPIRVPKQLMDDTDDESQGQSCSFPLVCHIESEYGNAMTKYKKRFFDFLSREGHGELVWEGKINPHVFISYDRETISAPLPVLLALTWFINTGLDLYFWAHLQDIMKAYKEHTNTTKERYTLTQKLKKVKKENVDEMETEISSVMWSGLKRKKVDDRRSEHKVVMIGIVNQ